MLDLLPPRDPSDGHLRIPIRRRFQRGEQPVGPHGPRQLIVLRLVPKGARHAAAAGAHQLHVIARHQPQGSHGGPHAHQRLLVTVTVEQHPRGHVIPEDRGHAGVLTHQCIEKFLQQEGLGGHCAGGLVPEEVRVLVAEREQAGWLGPHDGHTPPGVGQ